MRTPRRLPAIGLGVLLVALVAYAFYPRPVPVETATVSRGPLRVTLQGSGRTRVKDRFTVHAPTHGHLQRIGLRAGDRVEAGQAVAWVVPALPAQLDARARAETSARITAAMSAQAEARAQAERAKVALALARKEVERARTLAQSQAVSVQSLEEAEFAVSAREKELGVAESAIDRAGAEVATFRAMLIGPRQGANSRGDRLPIPAPVSGVVLRVLRESEGPVVTGTPLVELGDPSRLEAVLDLLTTQAARIRPGASATLEQWGGPAPLRAKVTAIEPSGFTKVSALGVEEQRVNVLLEAAEPGGWNRLGDGYHVEGHVLVYENREALKVPAGALFRQGKEWSAYRIDHRGRAMARTVRTGESDGDEIEILEGMSEGDRVVVHPSDKISSGVSVRAL